MSQKVITLTTYIIKNFNEFSYLFHLIYYVLSHFISFVPSFSYIHSQPKSRFL